MPSSVTHDSEARTFDCAPTLTDSQVLEFCRDGHLLLKGVVPDEINQKCCDWLDGKIPLDPSFTPPGMTLDELERIRGSHEPSAILLEDWFIEHVLLNPQLAGALRSLLGASVGLPVITSHHRVEGPDAGPGLASRRRPHLRPRAQLSGSLLFPAGHACRARPHGGLSGHPHRTRQARFRGAGHPARRTLPAPSASITRASCTGEASPPRPASDGC